jgi:hypothetical protein
MLRNRCSDTGRLGNLRFMRGESRRARGGREIVLTQKELKDMISALSAGIENERDLIRCHTVKPWQKDQWAGVRNKISRRIKRWIKLQNKLCATVRGDG